MIKSTSLPQEIPRGSESSFTCRGELQFLEQLKIVFNSRGYEVLTYPHPGTCPKFVHKSCSCPDNQSCTDIILADINMPVMGGIDFIEMQLAKGCSCRHLALMSGDFSNEDERKAKELGLKFFKKPFELPEVFERLDKIEHHLNPQRRLADFKNLCNYTSKFYSIFLY